VDEVRGGAGFGKGADRLGYHLVRSADIYVAARPARLGGQFGDGSVHDIAGRLVGYGGNHLKPWVAQFQLAQVVEIVQVHVTARAEVQRDLAALASRRGSRDRLDDGFDRGQAGSTGQAEQVPGRTQVGGHRPGRSAENERIAHGHVVDECMAHHAALGGLYVQAEASVRARGIGYGVCAPQPGPVQCLYADVLAGEEGQRLIRLQGQHGDAGPPWLGTGHRGDPPCRDMLRVAPGRLHHDRRGIVEGGFEGLLRGVVPRGGGELPHGREQRPAEQFEVLVTYAILAMRTAEPLQVGYEAARVVLARDDPGETQEEPAPLCVHAGREHRGDLGVHGEKLTVEIRHRRVGGRLKQRECRLGGTLA